MKNLQLCCHLALFLCPVSLWSQSTAWSSQKLNSQPNDRQQRTAGFEIAWRAEYASGLNPGAHEASAIAIDSEGNIYLTGKSPSSSTGFDFATVKYSSAGVEQWAVRYNGPGNLDDVATAITVDNEKNVYVTGSSGHGYATVKYNVAGIQLWSARYKSPGNFDEIPAAIAVDAAGNVFVTGEGIVQTVGQSYESSTVKYNSSGVQQWVIHHGFVGNGTVQHQIVRLALDNNGSVIVAGPGFTPGTMIDFTTIKYNSAGIEQWRVRYTDPNAPSGTGDDYVSDLGVDQSGNIYVTGTSQGNYVTVKYNSAGQQRWVTRYNGGGLDVPSDLAVDPLGNVYVTGNTSTVKYNANGVEQWRVAMGVNIVTNQHEEVYVTSINDDNFFTTKYSANSTEQWKVQEQGKLAALTIDNDGNIYMAATLHSGLFSSYATTSYDLAGQKLWTAQYAQASGSSWDGPVAQVVDEAGNVYVTGWSLSRTLFDFATVKYDASGVQRWVARYNSPGDGWDEPRALTIDKQGNVYVTGNTSSGFVTVKYNSAGVERWVTNWKNPRNYSDDPKAITVDDAGNVYVAADFTSENAVREYLTVKYNSVGAQQWEAHYKGPSDDQEDVPVAIGVDALGNVYITGRSGSANTQDWHDDFATIKYDASGNELWVARYNGLGGISYDEATRLVVDAKGNCYITGQSNGEYATIKYNTSGRRQWVARFDGTPEDHADEPTDLAVDVDGNVYVTGVGTPDNNGEYITVKYDEMGTLLWVARRRPGIWASLAIDKTGNVYVGGYDVILKYDAHGNEVGRLNEGGIGIGVDGSGGVYTSRKTENQGSSFYMTTKYSQIGTAVDETRSAVPHIYTLEQNWPNPFNPTTVISFQLPVSSEVTLSIFNTNGQLVKKLVAGEMNAGTHNFTWDATNERGERVASGVYLYMIKAGEFTAQRKLVLMK